MKSKTSIFICILSIMIIVPSFAQTSILEVGDRVKTFSAKADNGKKWKSKHVIGNKNLVVYFYPAAMTGGCTTQACAYRDSKDDLTALDAEVVGVSGDEVKNLELFKRAHKLNFTLLSDPEGEIAAMFGVPVKSGERSIEREVENNLYTLTRNVTTSRWTFVINKDGRVVYKSSDVNAAEDSKNVVEILQKLE